MGLYSVFDADPPPTSAIRRIIKTYVAVQYRSSLPALIIILGALVASEQPEVRAASDPAQGLAQKVIQNEVKASKEDQSRWSFEKTTEKSGRKEESVVVETKDGDLERLISVNGQSLTPAQQKKEDERIQELLKNPSEQRKQQKDAQQMLRILKMLPQALLFSYGERRGNSIQLLFTPNPKFHPQSHEGRVLNALAGELWVNSKEDRIEEVKGHLIHDVRFLGGIGGHLDKGGTFYVKQIEAAPGHWLLATINVQMKGKVLFFKKISVQQIESHTHFHEVSGALTLAQAAQLLSRSKPLAQGQSAGPPE
jgi:hypothetical protein